MEISSQRHLSEPSSPSEEVLESASFIVRNARDVSIDQSAVEDLAEKFVLTNEPERLEAPTLEPPNLTPTELLEWIFLLDTLNFCFWSDESSQFTFSYRGVHWTGYRSLVAALTKAVEDGVPIYKPSYFGSVSEEKLRQIFMSETHVELPLIGRRKANLWEAARVLNKEFDGKVSKLIRRSEKSAQKLVSLLVEHFPSYRDMGTYRGRKVSFLKRAQIFAADVWDRFGGEGYGEFHDIHTLTMFADYRVPQSLLYFQVLQYSEELMQRLREGEHLEAGGEAEAEIRGCSIWAVELIRERMQELMQALPLPLHQNADEKKAGSSLLQNGPGKTSLPGDGPGKTSQPGDGAGKKGGVISSVALDYYLWNYAKTHSSELKQYPIHRTLTIFY